MSNPSSKRCDVSEESFDAKEGIVCNSPRPDVTPYCDLSLNGLTIKEAIETTKKYVKDHNLGRVKVNYRLRDAIFSRQRYWGEPFPVSQAHFVACPNGGSPVSVGRNLATSGSSSGRLASSII